MRRLYDLLSKWLNYNTNTIKHYYANNSWLYYYINEIFFIIYNI